MSGSSPSILVRRRAVSTNSSAPRCGWRNLDYQQSAATLAPERDGTISSVPDWRYLQARWVPPGPAQIFRGHEIDDVLLHFGSPAPQNEPEPT